MKGATLCYSPAPQFPTPAFTMVDLNLIRDLNLRMTDMQRSELLYGGQKLRTIVSIHNFHFSA